MKSSILMLLIATILCSSACSQKVKSDKIPSTIKTSFNAKFPGAEKVEWEMETKEEYEANFKLNNKEYSAKYSVTGSWLETEYQLPISELPAVISKAIQNAYPGAEIKTVEKLEMPNGKILFEIIMKVNGKKKEIELNADGSIVK